MTAAVVRRIDVTGWSTVVLGFLCVGVSALQAVMPVLLRRLTEAVGESDDAMRSVRAAWSTGSGTAALVNGIFGAALVVAGIAVLRRVRWAHRALEASCWASIAVLAVLAKPSLAPLMALAGQDSGANRSFLVAGVVLLVVQIAAVLWFLRFWRRNDVRDVFR